MASGITQHRTLADKHGNLFLLILARRPGPSRSQALAEPDDLLQVMAAFRLGRFVEEGNCRRRERSSMHIQHLIVDEQDARRPGPARQRQFASDVRRKGYGIIRAYSTGDDGHERIHLVHVALQLRHAPDIGLLIGSQSNALRFEKARKVAVDGDVAVAVAEVGLHWALGEYRCMLAEAIPTEVCGMCQSAPS